jgi:hypothetical protein
MTYLRKILKSCFREDNTLDLPMPQPVLKVNVDIFYPNENYNPSKGYIKQQSASAM